MRAPGPPCARPDCRGRMAFAARLMTLVHSVRHQGARMEGPGQLLRCISCAHVCADVEVSMTSRALGVYAGDMRGRMVHAGRVRVRERDHDAAQGRVHTCQRLIHTRPTCHARAFKAPLRQMRGRV